MARIVIVGAGPRGTTVLERIVAHALGVPRPPEGGIDVHVADPFPAGPGRVWRTDQSACLLMNTVLEEQTVFPDPSVQVTRRGTGPSMAEWAAGVLAGRIAAADEVLDDLRRLASPGFPPRRLYGHYLAWAFERIRGSAPSWLRVHVHRAEVLEILDPPSYNPQRDDSQVVRLDDGSDLQADHVVLCLGHLPAQPAQSRRELAEYAARTRLYYQPPNLPAEVDLDAVAPADAAVIVRGFGLNFFDLLGLVTTGRGGRFEQAPDADAGLVYRASGIEPVLWVGSRRGVPYRAKPIIAGRPVPRARLRWTTEKRLRTLAVRQDGELRFNRDVWPGVLADIRLAYYDTLARVSPGALATEPAVFLERIAPEHEAGFDELEAVVVPDPADRLDLHTLIDPLQGMRFTSRSGFDMWMRTFLRADIAEARRGEGSPVKMVQAALTAARLVIKELVADGLFTETSFADELRGWFEGFAASLCDGPPVQRIEQTLALHEAGLLHFAGPAIHVTGAVGTERPGFELRSPQIDAEPLLADHLIDAASPVNRVVLAEDRLLRSLLDTGAVRPPQAQLENGRLYTGSGLDVAGPTHCTVDAHGRAHPGRHVLGLQLSSVQWGLAIAAQPGTNARTLRDADAIARTVLGLG